MKKILLLLCLVFMSFCIFAEDKLLWENNNGIGYYGRSVYSKTYDGQFTIYQIRIASNPEIIVNTLTVDDAMNIARNNSIMNTLNDTSALLEKITGIKGEWKSYSDSDRIYLLFDMTKGRVAEYEANKRNNLSTQSGRAWDDVGKQFYVTLPSGGSKWLYLVELNEYDVHGNKVHSKIPNDDRTFSYNSVNKVIYVKEIQNCCGEEKESEEFYDYDKESNLVHEKVNSWDGTCEVSYEYDSNEKLIYEKEVFDKGEIFETLYEYDKDGKCVHSKFLINKKLDCEFWYEYDSENRKVKEKRFIAVDNSSIETIFKYDDTGNLIYEGLPEHWETFYEYDSKRNLIHERQGDSSYEITYVYDENENLIHEVVSGESPYEDFYEYNEKGQLCIKYSTKL